MSNPQYQTPAQPVDTILLGALKLNAERPGRCAQCQQATAAPRILRTTYRPPALSRRERDQLDQLSRATSATTGATPEAEAQVVDHYLQRFARRQLRGDLGDETRMALCVTCATRWLVDCLEHGPGLVKLGRRADTDQATRAARGFMAEGLSRRAPLFAAVVWRVERGPDGRSQPSVVIHPGGPIAPQILLRAHGDLRRYAHEYGRSIF